MKGEFTAVFERRGKWIVAYVEEIPGVNTQGRTMKEARENLREALEMVLEANRRIAERGLRGTEAKREPIAVNF